MVLLSMSFCFAAAGWMALPLLLVLTLLGGYTGALIVLSYATIAEAGETVPSYAKIGEHSCGTFGKWLVVVSSVIETFFCIVSMNIITWKNIACLMPSLPLTWLILGSVMLSFPTNWLTDFNRLSFLSAFGLGCVIFICADIGYEAFERLFVESPLRQAHEQHELLNFRGLPMAASIMFAGLTGHVSLPPIYASMKRPSRFASTLVWSFSAMFLFYAFVGACGYLLYGADASVIVTEDMSRNAHGAMDRLLVSLILVGMAFKLFCSVPMCVVVLTDITENLYLEKHGRYMRKNAIMYWRISFWLAGVILSVVFYDSLEYVTAFVGVHSTEMFRLREWSRPHYPNHPCARAIGISCMLHIEYYPTHSWYNFSRNPSRLFTGMNSLLISVILPIAFYLIIHWRGMSTLSKAWYLAVLILSTLLTMMISWVDVNDFIDSITP
eukprot:scaffold25588_cov40-Tisochrysis_lutea.AAC.2